MKPIRVNESELALDQRRIDDAKRGCHGKYWKIMHRATHLFHQGMSKRHREWSMRGHLFRSSTELHRFIKMIVKQEGMVPSDWEVVPVELMVREESRRNARLYWDEQTARNAEFLKSYPVQLWLRGLPKTNNGSIWKWENR